ncbi:MAG: hypothetical protein CM15mP77_1720 [Synechococcus sp.]|nr:MAG: hypothetical protein CM15mP77_1720 [Synechococcus sp.]
MPIKQAMADPRAPGKLSHLGSGTQTFLKNLKELFRTYGETFAGKEALLPPQRRGGRKHNARLVLNPGPGQFTPWEDIPPRDGPLFLKAFMAVGKGEGYDVAPR